MTSALKSQLRKVGMDFDGVKDAENPITIFINQDDIDQGRSGSAMQCTAARCLQRATGGNNVAMFLNTAYVQLPNEKSVTRYKVPQGLRENVVIPQDTGGVAIPGAYTLKVPVGHARLGQAVIRRAKLQELRSKGMAPPARKKIRRYLHNVRSRWMEGKEL